MSDSFYAVKFVEASPENWAVAAATVWKILRKRMNRDCF